MPFRSWSTITALSLACLFPLPLAAVEPEGDGPPAQDMPQRPEQVAQVRLVADARRIEPGATFHLAVIFELAPQWHIYWLDPGDSGAPTEIEVTAPEGFRVGPTLYPRPSAFREEAGITYGYTDRAVLFVPVTAPHELDASTVSFSADVFYFVCREICLMGHAERELELAVGSDASPPIKSGSADDELMDRFRDRLPRELQELKGAEVRVEEHRLVITGPLQGHETVEFFPVRNDAMRFGETKLEKRGELFHLVVEFDRQDPAEEREDAEQVRGLIGLGREPDAAAYWFEVPLTAKRKGAS